MSVTIAEFRQNFPEFADIARYPDPMVTFWLGFAITMLNADRWGASLDYGLQLMTAHQVVLAARNVATPGGIIAPQSSKTVDKVSVSYDTSAVRLENAGHWAGTSYGMQFWQLVRMIGAGGMQL